MNNSSSQKTVVYKNNYDQSRRNRLIFLGGVIAFITLVVVIAMAVAGNKFRVVSTVPENGSSTPSSSAQIEFIFNKALSASDKGSVSVAVQPRADFIFVYGEKSITLKLSDLALAEDVSYSITLKDIFSDSGDRIKSTNSQLFVELNSKQKSLLTSLPVSKNNYTISLTDNNQLKIEGTLEKDLREADKMLEDAEISKDIFKIIYVNRDEIEGF